MAYITGTITSANPGADMYAALAPALTTAGFTLVDTVVISTRTHKIWKSPAAGNAQNLDWYLDVAYSTSGTGDMWFFPMEFFDPATHLAYRMVLSGSNFSVIEQTYYSPNGATGYSLENASWIIRAPNATALSLIMTTSAFGYWISVTSNRLIALSSADPSAMVYSGFFTPRAEHVTAAASSLFPLVYIKNNGTTSGASTSPANVSAAVTRLPKAASLAGSGWGGFAQVSASSVYAPALPGVTTVVSNPQLFPLSVAASAAHSPGGTLGTVDGMALTWMGAVVRGDTVTVGADTWICATPTGNTGLLMAAV